MKQEKKWLWEFSKRVVVICTFLYVVMFIYACVEMEVHDDFTYLSNLIDQTSDILKTCVFGYLVKAGFENVFKIKNTE